MPATTALRRTVAVLATLPLLALAACGYGSEAEKDDGAKVAAGAEKTDGLDSVRIGYFGNVTHATALVGNQKGFFQKALGATETKYATFNAGPSEIEALNSGSIDIGWIGPSPSINGYTKSGGKNLRIIGGSASGGVKLVVNPDKIKSLKDVKGKRIATPQLGNTQDVAFLNWIAEQGWKVDAQSGKGDVTVVRSDNKVTPDAYKSGSLDGAWVPEPTASKLVAEGGKVLLDESTLWPDKKFVITNIIVSQKFLAEHPKAVEAVLKASVETNEWIKANPDEAKAAANKQLEKDTGKALPADVLDPAWKSIQLTDDPLAATLDAQADHAVKAGLLDKPDLAGIYDLTLLNKVLAAKGRPAVDDAGLGAK
ncbi:aliphatic sulfonate ABC transporter substrate-binding protein [Streptomyces parvulus]|uniref:Aliphatic sulfonate ABC transporter substrate-binding protein n=1 Tax=Streptomyces parvulus TaxID=146923 RepID=A0A191V4Y9_9ACTN|nr:aliphatic sulfonate ABC transporter substrate-binding protein [Streptomyces parvulus]MZD58145.1 aliphatic sulfonate ABC transporter substrate-binding protein [Streptomyces sp. SID5606]ANJ10076.1 sulfate ABC transporter substrate-binding protein [Streptomyces parvulus]MCC9154066.1 aliphatic sulfonate ABC transporter substrate-binding protein [Streptomyces parvulus]MCE7689110.1 aliphatic sulfonate ABC transporter substrate-binding protein [Streptomyces parvulus]GGR87390.1 lipoprotein [Strepto